ncbi:MAG: phospholipase D-like domain-containing protein, partial [Candidatus Dormibacteria bacterium]
LLLGGLGIAEALAPLLAAARHRLLVLVPYVHREATAVGTLLGPMRGLAQAGGDVRLLLGQPPAAHQGLTGGVLGLPVAVMDPLRCTTGHAKGVVADDVAVVGSANWSGAGLGANREAALVLHSTAVADYFAAAFEHDWATARPLP